MTNAIIFDFDGVICESMNIKERGFLHVFRDYPRLHNKIVALHRAHGGMSRYEKFKIIYRDMLKKPCSDKEGEKLAQKFSTFVNKEILNCPYVPGALEFFKKYHNQLSLFIASGTPQEELREVARRRGIRKYFVKILGAPASKAENCKKVLREYGFAPDEVIMVGDSIDDYAGASEAGIGFVGRIADKNPFTNSKIKGTISDLTELDKFL